jgi:hypothetical protein
MMSLEADEENSFSSFKDDEMTTDDSIATTLPHPGMRIKQLTYGQKQEIVDEAYGSELNINKTAQKFHLSPIQIVRWKEVLDTIGSEVTDPAELAEVMKAMMMICLMTTTTTTTTIRTTTLMQMPTMVMVVTSKFVKPYKDIYLLKAGNIF